MNLAGTQVKSVIINKRNVNIGKDFLVWLGIGVECWLKIACGCVAYSSLAVAAC